MLALTPVPITGRQTALTGTPSRRFLAPAQDRSTGGTADHAGRAGRDQLSGGARSTKKPVSTCWYSGADSQTSHSRCRPGQLVYPRSRTQAWSEALGVTHRSAQGQRHKLFQARGMPGRLSRYASSIQPGRGHRKQGRVWRRCNPTKVMIAGEGYMGLVMRAAAAERCLVPAAPRGSEQNGRYPSRAIQ